MKKKIAKIFKKYGNGKIEIIKEYKATTLPKGETTVAIKGSRRDINKAIGYCIIKGSKGTNEAMMIGELLIGDYYEDWDSDKGLVIKY